jgi:hypothetical protein
MSIPSHKNKKSPMLVIGKALLFAGLQFSLGSVEMSSKFSVKNFSTSQEVLNHAADALTDYLVVALLWIVGTSLVFYSNYGFFGLVANILANIVIVLWITLSYIGAFKLAAKANNLVVPKLFRNRHGDV